MKKILSCAVVLALLLALCLPAMATEFTPSVTNKPSPDIVLVNDDDGDPSYGVILDLEGNVVSYVKPECLVITAVADAETSPYIPAASKALLLDVYDKLNSGAMTLPYEKFNAGPDASKMVVRDLFDATFLCEEHPAALEPEGTVFQITFDLGVEADQDVYVMTYKNNEWNPIVKAVNNGNGTVTCTFEHLCPIAFSVEVAEEEPTTPPVDEPTTPGTTEPSQPGTDMPPETGDTVGNQLPIWGLVAAISLLAVIVLTVLYRRSLKKEQN